MSTKRSRSSRPLCRSCGRCRLPPQLGLDRARCGNADFFFAPPMDEHHQAGRYQAADYRGHCGIDLRHGRERNIADADVLISRAPAVLPKLKNTSVIKVE